MKKIKLLKTLLVPTIGITAISTIIAVSTSCSPVVIVTDVSLNKNSLTLDKGGSETLTATVHPENATDKSVTWSSSNSSVATVDNNGNVTAVGAGSAKITVKTNNGGYEDYCDVTVTYTAPSYICITANADSTLELINNGGSNPNLHYSADNKNWTTYSGKINIPANGKIYLIGDNSEGWSLNNEKYSYFSIVGNVSLSGNVMSLLDNGTETISSIPNDYCFYKLFYNSEEIISVSKDFLPATKLAKNCYAHMFENCTSLTTAPALPATTLANFCYFNMFSNCTSITTAPELSATELATACYSSMFYGCTSLTIAPALPATTLANYCYWNMFKGCTSLTQAPDLPATQLVEGCYANMFISCQSLITAPTLPAANLAKYCYDSMFYDCSYLTTAPALPATTLANNCYSYMFYGCTSLTTAPDLPATNLVQDCYSYMFDHCSSLASIRIGYIGNYAKLYFDSWVSGVASSGIFYYKGTDSLASFGFPDGWIINPDSN